jgi:hypothetical protein
MASPSFQERFKNRATVMSHDGFIEVNPASAISKPVTSQVHNSVFKASASTIIKSKVLSPDPISYLHSSDNSFYGSESVAYTEPVPSKQPQQFTGKVKISQTRNIFQTDKAKEAEKKPEINSEGFEYGKGFSFTPYTLKDYKIIKPKQYYQLGGLGPVNIGTSDWARKKELTDKRLKYGSDIYLKNAAKLPLFPLNVPVKPRAKEENARQRALEFAKKIVRPPLKLPMFPN